MCKRKLQTAPEKLIESVSLLSFLELKIKLWYCKINLLSVERFSSTLFYTVHSSHAMLSSTRLKLWFIVDGIRSCVWKKSSLARVFSWEMFVQGKTSTYTSAYSTSWSLFSLSLDSALSRVPSIDSVSWRILTQYKLVLFDSVCVIDARHAARHKTSRSHTSSPIRDHTAVLLRVAIIITWITHPPSRLQHLLHIHHPNIEQPQEHHTQ